MAGVAITGAAGFVGSHVVPLLVREGFEVRGLARPGSDASSLAGTIEISRGDVRSLDRLRTLVDGCDYVIHLAASFSPLDDVGEIITAGTQNVVSAAREAGVKRLIYLSCLGADAAAENAFFAAKWKDESAVRGSDLPYVILRPSLVMGRRDGVVQPLAQLIRTAPAIPIPGKGENRQQPIDVDDLARCVLISLTSNAVTNELVSVGGTLFLTIRQLVDLIAGQIGVSKPKLLIPYCFLPLIAPSLPDGSRDIFVQPRLAQFRHGVVASPGIVQREFGFEPSSVVQRLAHYLS
jgi:NADH dehydrogenase